MSNNLDDYIVIVENAVTPALCAAILDEYVNSNDWVDTVVSSSHILDKTVRNCSTIGMSFPGIIASNQNTRGALDKYVHVSVAEILRKYREKFPNCSIEQDTGYELLRYTESQFYTEHTDSFLGRPRAVSCSIALNDDYEGGEWAFFGQKIKHKIAKGSAILFPSNFMYPHEILPVTKGTRYSVITWFV